MARRRTDDGLPDEGGDSLGFLQDFRGTEAPLIGGPDEQQFGGGGFGVNYQDPTPLSGDDLLRKIEEDRAAGAFDNAIAGNTDKARDLRPAMPNTISPSQSAPAPFALPRGVSANESNGSMEGGGDYSQDAPAMPMEPFPAAAQRANPQQTFQGASTAFQSPPATRRVSAAPSALFGEEGSSAMFGRAGGLLGGGQGILGAGDDGEIEPTEMFKKLLEMYGQA